MQIYGMILVYCTTKLTLDTKHKLENTWQPEKSKRDYCIVQNILHRVVIYPNIPLVTQLTSYIKEECNVPWYNPTWDIVICQSITNNNYKMIKQTSNRNYIGTSRYREE